MARARAELRGRGVWTVGVVLLVVAAASATLFGGCGGGGGGGGSSNGKLCEQCGQSDGPCLTSVTISGGADAQALCQGLDTCNVDLACLRKLGSAQRRCFPADFQFNLFECDGARANRATSTPTPSPTTTPLPTPTVTSTGPTATGLTPTPMLTLSPTPEPTSTPFCGNNVVDDNEECDGTDLDGNTCDDLCDENGGVLSCNPNCTFNFSLCAFPLTCSPP